MVTTRLSPPRAWSIARSARGGAEEEPSALQKLADGVKSFFGLKKKEDKKAPPAPLSLFDSLPGPLGIVGAVMKPMLQLMGGMLQESQDDVEQVLAEAKAAMLRSGRFGRAVECGPIFGQSYSSMSVNGQKTAQVQLQFEVQLEGGARTGRASCSAAIGPDSRVALSCLEVDGASVSIGGGGGSSGVGGIIDVER